MFTPMEKEYFEKFMESQFDNVHSKLDHQIQLQKIANGRTAKLENEVSDLKHWRSTSQGHWSGVAKTVTIIATVIAFVGGIIATMLWH